VDEICNGLNFHRRASGKCRYVWENYQRLQVLVRDNFACEVAEKHVESQTVAGLGESGSNE